MNIIEENAEKLLEYVKNYPGRFRIHIEAALEMRSNDFTDARTFLGDKIITRRVGSGYYYYAKDVEK